MLKPEEEWPQRPDQMSAQQDPEIKNEFKVNILNIKENNDILSKLTHYYSSWFCLKKAVAWVLRLKETLLQLCKARRQFQEYIAQSEKDPEKQLSLLQEQMQKYRSTMEKKSLKLKDLNQAEIQLIQFSQKQQFQNEIEA